MPRLAVAIVCIVGFVATAVHAADRRIALVQGDAELQRSVSLALSPWGVETVPTNRPTPGSSLPDGAQRAAELARQLDVDAVVWVSVSGQGAVLWVYEARNDETTTRVLVETPPFESSAAAAIALSVKTVLRATTVAPESERFGATPAQSLRKAERVAIETGADVHVLAARSVDPRITIGTVVWFVPPTRLGAALTLAAGPGVRMENDSYSGRYREIALGWSLRWRFANTDWVAAELLLGSTAHFTALDGAARAGGPPVDIHRFNASVDGGALVELKPTAGVYLGISAQAGYLLAYQRYLVEGNPVFALSPIGAVFGGHFGVDLF
jgi:hypothetical protein